MFRNGGLVYCNSRVLVTESTKECGLLTCLVFAKPRHETKIISNE